MLWAKWTLLVLGLINVGIYLAKFGEKKSTTKYGWYDFINVFISFTLLYCAGALPF